MAGALDVERQDRLERKRLAAERRQKMAPGPEANKMAPGPRENRMAEGPTANKTESITGATIRLSKKPELEGVIFLSTSARVSAERAGLTKDDFTYEERAGGIAMLDVRTARDRKAPQ